MTGKDMGDIAATSGAVGAYLQWLPEVAALMAIIWTGIRIYEWVLFRICKKSEKELFK